MVTPTSMLTVENKKEIAKKIGILNKIQLAFGKNPALTLDQMLMNTQISPETRAVYEHLMAQARTLIAVTMQNPTMDKEALFQTLAQQECFKDVPDLLLLSYALELRMNGFRPITAVAQKEAETRFLTYCDKMAASSSTTQVPEEQEPVNRAETEPATLSDSLAGNVERDVLKKELMQRTRALIKLNHTNRVVERNGHKVPYPFLNPYFDWDGHLNIGFTDLTNNAYLLDYLKIKKNQSDELTDYEKETLLVDLNDKYEELGQPQMSPSAFTTLDGFKEYSVSPDNASRVADLQITDDLDDLFQDLEQADLAMTPFPFLQVALDIVYETGYALSETNPDFYDALLTGHFDTLTDEAFIPKLDDRVWNNVQRAKRRRALIQLGMQQLQKNAARPMGGAGKVANVSDNVPQNQPTENQK